MYIATAEFIQLFQMRCGADVYGQSDIVWCRACRSLHVELALALEASEVIASVPKLPPNYGQVLGQ